MPFFEHPPVLFTPRIADEDMMKARIENQGNTQFVFVPKQENAQSQWS